MLADITAYLEDEGVGTQGVNLFYSLMPDQPDSCVAVFEYGGRPPVFEHDSPQPALEYPRVQVLARDPDYDTARSLARDAHLALSEVVNMTLGATRFLRITPLQAPFFLRRDESGRVEFVCNFEVTIDP
jgi:hypothetical protein